MKINWKVRFKNRVFLASVIALVVSFVYDWLALMDIAPTLNESIVMSIADGVLTALVAIGIVTDPTTAGTADSALAMTYEEPKR